MAPYQFRFAPQGFFCHYRPLVQATTSLTDSKIPVDVKVALFKLTCSGLCAVSGIRCVDGRPKCAVLILSNAFIVFYGLVDKSVEVFLLYPVVLLKRRHPLELRVMAYFFRVHTVPKTRTTI